MYEIKKWPDGSVERYKTQLVAWGFPQQYGLDYEEMYNSMVKLTTARVLLVLEASKEWKLLIDGC